MSNTDSQKSLTTVVSHLGWIPPIQLTARLRMVAQLAERRGGWSEKPSLWVIAAPDDVPEELDLLPERVEVGRELDPKALKAGRGLSRRHFAVWKSEATWMVEDVGSRNGTMLNGELLTEPKSLHDGDWVEAGGLLFVANLPEGG